ncbi:MAG TPA: DUF3224 domain-containing protein [Paucimonas sp.]|nr:DUF3224 domain-containing protein [Paucimonas sp.]
MHSTLRMRGATWIDEVIDGMARRYCVVKFRYSGDLEGESALMLFPDAALTAFVGLERVAARIGDQFHELYVRHAGTIHSGRYFSRAHVVSGPDADQLPGLREQWELTWGERPGGELLL